MREIKFRAWDKFRNEMLPVHALYNPYGGVFQRADVWIENNPEDHKVSGRNIEDDVEIMQFTGLKDKNGKEIYEGDILQARDVDGNGVGKYIIEWDFVRYRMKNVNGDDGVVWFNSPYIEVVGNVFENPELIKNV